MKSDKFKDKKFKKATKKTDVLYEDSETAKKRKLDKMDKKDKKYSKSNKRVDRYFEADEEAEVLMDDDDGSRRRPKKSSTTAKADKPKPFRGEQNGSTTYRRPVASKNPHGDKRKREVTKSNDSGEIRLNKYIANSGVCSRREADDYIKAGLVTINDVLVTELGTKVKPNDIVKFNGESLRREKLVYLLLNKPKDYVTTMEDPHATKSVMQLIEKACTERIYPVGRLDKSTTGVLLFTNDGDLAKKLTHPKFNVKKIYHVHLDKNVTKGDMVKIAEGFDLDDGFIQADAINYVGEEKNEIGIEIHSGRNRVVRRLFEKLGYNVTKLDRVFFAGLTKKQLTRGHWRFLTEKEVIFLKMGKY